MPEVAKTDKKSGFHNALPALTLLLMAPLIAEVLPGATRISSLFVFPIEVLIWGGGTVLIRYLVRTLKLGWFNLVLLALALAVAEECLIQQTSLAPLVIKLKGIEYARLYGINYVYLLWALIYEALFVVLIPIGLCELIFPSRRDNGWLNGGGVAALILLFAPASGAAWYSWTQIARTTVFHLPAYDIPPAYALTAAGVIAGLLLLALGPVRRILAAPAKALTPPHPLIVAVLSLGVGVVLFGEVVLAFGIKPDFPPIAAVAVSLLLGALLLALVPRWMADARWSRWHDIAALYGAVLGNMGAMFIGFIGAAPIDLYGKIVLDVIAVVLMVWLMVARPRKAV